MQIRGMCVERTDHMIIPHGDHRMVLGDHQSGEAIIIAERHSGIWSVSAPWADTETVTVETRREAVTAMTDMALAVGPKTGYSTFIPDFQSPDGTRIPLADMP